MEAKFHGLNLEQIEVNIVAGRENIARTHLGDSFHHQYNQENMIRDMCI